MPDANFVQTSFLGGEWSPFAQGRADQPAYRTALNVCLNTIPVEEGAAVRRPGTQRLAPTYGRAAAKFLPFVSSTACAFLIEITSGAARFWSGMLPICTNDPRTISTAAYSGTALTLALDTNSGWAAGDQVMFSFPDGYSPALEALCRGRVLRVSSASLATLVLADDEGNPLTIPALATGALVGATVLRLVRKTVPWAASLDKLRIVQAESDAVILSTLQPPQTLTVTEPTGSNDPVFTLAASAFVDGPYLDPQPDTGTVSGYTGTITFTPASSTFVAGDVGRHIRLFSEPAAWASGTTYANGATVTYNGGYWKSVVGSAYTNVGVPPGSPLTTSAGIQVAVWAPSPLEGQWAWGKITAQAGSSCTVALQTNLNSANGATITTWQLGLFEAGAYPICGTYHGGRLWLAGAAANRFDGSMSNAPYTFSPTDIYGNVNDDSAIAYTLNATELESIVWMRPDQQGVLAGTLYGEWLIAASTLADPLTPTSIDAKRVTKYGSREAEAITPGMAHVFIQRYGRRVMEYLADTFSGRFTGKHLNEFSKHLSTAGIVELAYQEENTPIVWGRTDAGQLLGCTYRRVSRFVTENPVYTAWHQHTLGGGTVNSMCVLPAETGLDDRLYLNVIADNGDSWVEVLRPIPEVDDAT